MKANPGGYIHPSEVIGRDELIQRLWHILEGRSLILCSVRRLGKTSVIKKMVAEAPQDRFLTVYQDLEGIQTPLEFSKAAFYGVRRHLSALKRTTEGVRQFLGQVGGLKIAGLIRLPDKFLARHWKEILTKTIEHLVKYEHRTVILFWDEVPIMLDNIKKQKGEGSGEGAAMEVLNTLRSLRQTHRRLRMVFTGSIGFHHVITSLKLVGHANASMNDMEFIDVPPLPPKHAHRLARLILKDEKILTQDMDTTAKALAEAVDGNPYYIHCVVSRMKDGDLPGNEATVREIVDDCLKNQDDPWQLSHYRDRINIYYNQDEQTFALNLLDILSSAGQPLTFDDTFNLLMYRMNTEDREMVRHVLKLLQRDYYIQQTDGEYCFRFPLIRRWWRIDKELA